MAREIKTRLSLDGEQQFKAGLQSVDREMRVMQSQLKALTSGYDGNDKSVADLARQHDLLKERVTLSQNKVKALEGAVEDSTAAYEKAVEEAKKMAEAHGENSEEAIKAANAAAKAEATMDGYRIKLANAQTQLSRNTAELKNFEKEMDAAKPASTFDQAAASVKKFGEALAPVIQKTGEIAAAAGKISFKAAEASVKAFSETTKAALQAGIKVITAYTAAVTGIGTALVTVTQKAASAADELDTLSVQTGISTEELQKYAYASEVLDVSVETISGSMAKLIKNMSSAKKGTGNAAEAFKTLKVSVTNADGSLRSNQEVFSDTIAALSRIENETERDALAMTVLGKSAQELNPLIEGGTETLNQLGDAAENLGLILDQKAINKLHAFNDSIDILKANASASASIIALRFADSFRAVTDLIGENVPSIASALAGVFDGKSVSAARFSRTLVDVGKQLSDKISGMAPSLLRSINNLFLALGDAANEMVPEAVATTGRILQNALGSLIHGITNRLPYYFETIAATGTELFNGLLTGLNRTAEQIVSVLPATLGKLSGAIQDGIPQMLDTALALFGTIVTGLAEAAETLLPMIPPMLAKIGNSVIKHLPGLLNTVVLAATNAIRFVADHLSSAVSGVGSVVGTILDNLFSGSNLDAIIDAALGLITAVVDAVMNNLPKLLTSVGKIVQKVSTFLQTNLPKILNTAIGLIRTLLRDIPTKVLPALMQALPKIAEAVYTLLPQLIRMIAEMLPQLYEAIGEMVTELAKMVASYMPEMAKTIAESVSVLYPELYDSFVTLMLALSNALNDQTVINALIDSVPVLVQAVCDTVKATAPILAAVTIQLGKQIIASIPTLIPALLDVLLAIQTPFLKWLSSTMSRTKEQVADGLAKLLERMERGAKNAITAFFNFFDKLPERIAYLLGSALKEAISFAAEMPKKAENAAKDFLEKIVNGIKDLPQKMRDTFNQMLDAADRWKKDIGSKASEAASNMWNNVVDGIKSLPDQIKDIGRKTVEGLWNGIDEKASWLGDRLRAFCSNIIEAFRRGFGDISSASVSQVRSVSSIANNISAGFANAIRDVTDTAISNVSQEVMLNPNARLNARSTAASIAGNVFNFNITVQAELTSEQSIRDTAEKLADETQKALSGIGKW